jgi:hypothetical protein
MNIYLFLIVLKIGKTKICLEKPHFLAYTATFLCFHVFEKQLISLMSLLISALIFVKAPLYDLIPPKVPTSKFYPTGDSGFNI